MTTKILVVGDDGTSTGYGRISSEINRRLVKRGYHVMAASLAYDGLLPAMYDGEPLPYHVASMQGKPNWPDIVISLINAYNPDVIHCIQDAPYGVIIRNAPIDWTKYAFVMTTPVDGAPIYPAWVEMGNKADALMTISEFGVKTWAGVGIQAGLARPGINADKFFKLSDDARLEIRRKLGIADDAFVLGMFCMHQGRKSVPQTVKGFFDFAKDKPTARLMLDMEAVSPAGWDLPAMCKQFSWDVNKIIFRTDAIAKGVTELRDRFNALDAHAVLAFREGYGLPIPEAMACGVVNMAQDWCAGTEVLQDGRGILIPSIDYFMPSTWGNALDKLPDIGVFTSKLQWLFDNPDERRAMAKRGMEWARTCTWDAATDMAANTFERVLEKRKKTAISLPVIPQSAIIKIPEPLPQSPDGINREVALVEGPA